MAEDMLITRNNYPKWWMTDVWYELEEVLVSLDRIYMRSKQEKWRKEISRSPAWNYIQLFAEDSALIYHCRLDPCYLRTDWEQFVLFTGVLKLHYFLVNLRFVFFLSEGISDIQLTLWTRCSTFLRNLKLSLKPGPTYGSNVKGDRQVNGDPRS